MTEVYWTDPIKQDREWKAQLIHSVQEDSREFGNEVQRRFRSGESLAVDMVVRAYIVGVEFNSDEGVTYTLAFPGSPLGFGPSSSEAKVRPESVTAWKFVE